MNPALTHRLMAVAAEADAAGHGQKSAIYAAAAEEMGVSVATLHRQLKAVRTTGQRKRRKDAGSSSLSLEEARMISAYLMESRRQNGKQLASLEETVEVLRSNGRILAGRVDEDTGEFRALSMAAIGRALRNYGLHPEQLSRSAPRVHLASEHPNHVWQIDPSLCVLYYLPTRAGDCLQVMDEAKFYKNKPGNIRRIEKERVWRYVITDHTSGVIYVHYVLGAESGKNLVEAFIGASQKRHSSDPFQGIPRMVMVDPGSANTGAVFQNLCRALGVQVQVNKPGQPWAKGQVEKANDQVERSFEHRLKTLKNPPTTVEEINQQAWAWMRWFNSHKVHSRTGKSRYAVWLTITPEQLLLAPDAKVMRELAVSAPVERKVSRFLTVSFKGQEFPVGDIPGVAIGEKLRITRNPWRDDAAQVLYLNDQGREVMQVVEALQQNEYGFSADAPVIGQEYRAQPDSHIDRERKGLERLAMQASTDQEAEQNRKAKTVPFGGDIDPMKPIKETPVPDYLPKRGTEMELNAPEVQSLTLTHVQAAKRLSGRMGNAWKPEHFQWLQQRYPEGVQEDDLPAIENALARPVSQPLRVVNGGDQG